MSIVIFIISIAVLIFVHELGHFLVAKKFGVRVDEFGLGLPPRLWGKKIGETLYSVNWIPFGGFVKIFGEDTHEGEIKEEDKQKSFYYKPKIIQSAVLVAGVTFNVIFAWLLISLGFSLGLPAPAGYLNSVDVSNPQTVIIGVLPSSPAEKAGLRSGDAIISVSSDENSLSGGLVTPEKVSEFISKNKSEKIEVLFKKGSENLKEISVIPSYSSKDGRRIIGISMDTIGTIKLPVHKALYEGARTTVSLIGRTATWLGSFFWGIVTLNSDFSQVTGPVGIVGSVGDASDLGFVYLISLIALISINLALINLVPFPALDGGRLLFVIIEAISRKKIPQKIFQWTNAVGFILLLILMGIVTIHDILRLI